MDRNRLGAAVVWVMGLLFQASGVAEAQAADPVRRMLDSLKPHNPKTIESAHAISPPTRVADSRLRPVGVPQAWAGTVIGGDPEATRQAAALWNLAPTPTTQDARNVDMHGWPLAASDAGESPSTRLLMDWEPNHQPNAQRYFDALHKARLAAANIREDAPVTIPQSHTNYGYDLMQRGAIHSAHDEFLEALWSVAQQNDSRQPSQGHVDCLASALETLDEADQIAELIREPDNQILVGRLASQHRNPAARRVIRQQLDAMAAMQAYYEVARSNLVSAMDGDRTGAAALRGLAATIQQQASHGTPTTLAAPRSMVLLLAAHQSAPHDYGIANELGVMYARFGEFEKAETLLKRSLLAQEHAEPWDNLARVWQLTGQFELAFHAQQRADQVRANHAATTADQLRLVELQELVDVGPVAPLDPPKLQDLVKAAAPPSGSDTERVEKASWWKQLFTKRPGSKTVDSELSVGNQGG